jgi:thermitase
LAAGDSPFSQRVMQHPSIVWYLQQHGVMLAVNNQIMVGEEAIASSRVTEYLGVNGWEQVGELFPRERPPGVANVASRANVPSVPNVALYQHAMFPKDKPVPDVVTAVRMVRGLLPAEQHPHVTPNHVLIPAPFGHSCPYGPPSPAPGAHALPPPQAGRAIRQITVIDSGYQWSPKWGANPLDPWVTLDQADWLGADGAWHPGAADVAGETVATATGNKLVALAGHANFIAGVIAQHCPHAHIVVRNHNGTVQPDAQDFATEASVARALAASVGSPVIDVGFAFWPLDGQISSAWASAIKALGGHSLVVAPAGNQGLSSPRYPAALAFLDPKMFSNVIGVASRTPAIPTLPPGSDGQLPPPCFTNYGPWVTCSADGHNVVSTFLKLDMKLEEQEPATAGPLDFRNGWAQWNGTSFAAPKVVAAIACALDQHPQPLEAWHSIIAGKPKDPHHRLGIELPF